MKHQQHSPVLIFLSNQTPRWTAASAVSQWRRRSRLWPISDEQDKKSPECLEEQSDPAGSRTERTEESDVHLQTRPGCVQDPNTP